MDVGDLIGELSSLHITNKSALSLDKPDAQYVLHLDAQSCESCGTSAKLAASSSNFTVRLFSRDSLTLSSSIRHTSPITGIKFSRSDPHLLYSSCEDSVIRSWDLRTKCTEAVSTYKGYDEMSNNFTAFDISCNDRVLCGGTDLVKEDVYLVFWDVRMTEKLGVYSDSHDGDITQVCYHSERADQLTTCCTDGLVCVFDISQESEDEALHATFNCESAVSRVGWCGEDLTEIYSLTDIATYHIWHSIQLDPVLEVTDLKETQKNIDYLVDCFQTTDQQLHLVAGSYTGELSMLRVSGDGVEHDMKPQNAHTGVIRATSWDQSTSSLVTGGEDSMLCLWTTGPEQATQQSHKVHLKAKSKFQQKKRSHGRQHHGNTHSDKTSRS